MEAKIPAQSSGPTKVTRRSLIGGTAGLVIAGVGGPGTRQASAGERGDVGADGAANGLEFLAEIAQVGADLTAYGYFTAVNGLHLDQVFFSADAPSETTARFTFSVTARLTSIQRHEGVFVAHAAGHLEMFLRDTPGATFDVPSSFSEGDRIAVDEATFENVLSLTAPDTALTTLFGDLRRTEVRAFKLDSGRYRLGRTRLRSRLVGSGKGTRTDPVGPRSILVVGGNITNPE